MFRYLKSLERINDWGENTQCFVVFFLFFCLLLCELWSECECARCAHDESEHKNYELRNNVNSIKKRKEIKKWFKNKIIIIIAQANLRINWYTERFAKSETVRQLYYMCDPILADHYYYYYLLSEMEKKSYRILHQSWKQHKKVIYKHVQRTVTGQNNGKNAKSQKKLQINWSNEINPECSE